MIEAYKINSLLSKGKIAMVGNLKSKRQSGFTIIEVLIVLAIAGLIMLVVFLAVPNLQRNSRNTQRRSDASSVLGAVQEVLNNNNGSMASITQGAVNTAAGTLSYYDISGGNLVVGAGAQTNATTVDTMSLRTGAKCSGADAVAGTTRQIALLYAVETNGGNTKVCINS